METYFLSPSMERGHPAMTRTPKMPITPNTGATKSGDTPSRSRLGRGDVGSEEGSRSSRAMTSFFLRASPRIPSSEERRIFPF
ncbi:MAG: hypothetical protein WBM29_10370, partial [Candidatus Deferrimicrobium sp.]